MKRPKAFTLVELLVVVAVIATLVAIFADCVWHDFLPRSTDVPGSNTQDPENGSSADRTLADITINRHSKAVNVSFWDGHVETVSLPQLWTIHWSATWSRNTPQVVH